jgi:uncharacterized RDD family membrane protein YckC
LKNQLLQNEMANPQAPSLVKLGACFIYETLIVIAIAFVCTLPFLMLVGDATHGLRRYCLQLLLWVCIGSYFVWCWHRKGQTLAMQTWHLKVINQNSNLLTVKQAILRYALATLSLLFFGMGYLWVLVDKNRLTLHDRLLKNRITFAPRSTA